VDSSSSLDLKTRWQQLVTPFGARKSAIETAYSDLLGRYGESGRHYHTLEHISAVLNTLESFGDVSPALQLAAWYHDAVYDSRATDNEERSASLARTALSALEVPANLVDEIARLILLTKTHQAAADDAAGQHLLDADLAILGAIPGAYDRYADAIRKEYAWVPDADYRAGRRRILAGFLARPQLYFHLKLAEEPARRNLKREIAALGG
jgi:predicted metal-dependent HD superfamily phosphohydrolase